MDAIKKRFRRLKFFFNRIRGEYLIKRKDKSFRVIIPERHRGKVKFFKYIFAAIGLFSAFIIFGSVWITFAFGFVIYVISLALEKISFQHVYAFIHPLPNFDMDPEQWRGVGFGYAAPPNGEYEVPIVSMIVSSLDYVKKLESLFLSWTNGKYEDEVKNVHMTVVVLNAEEYIFFCYPNPKRPITERFFQSARDTLKNKSLEDEIAEHHITLVLGKRCKVGKGSYFPQFRKRFGSGVPVAFDFILPPYDPLKKAEGIPSFIFFDFEIKDKSELTRKDFVYEMVYNYERGGTWQGPPEEDPALKK
jgi:hypothetical protein